MPLIENSRHDWQSRLYTKHAHWIAGRPPSMAIGDGWLDVVARLFDRISVALATEPEGTRLAVIDIKEKYGELRFDYFAPVGPEAEAAIEEAVLLAELRSECTCDTCGAAGRQRSTLGMSAWIAVRCDEHAPGYPRPVSKGPPRRRVRDRHGDREVMYDRASDTVTEIVRSPPSHMDEGT